MSIVRSAVSGAWLRRLGVIAAGVALGAAARVAAEPDPASAPALPQLSADGLVITLDAAVSGCSVCMKLVVRNASDAVAVFDPERMSVVSPSSGRRARLWKRPDPWLTVLPDGSRNATIPADPKHVALANPIAPGATYAARACYLLNSTTECRGDDFDSGANVSYQGARIRLPRGGRWRAEERQRDATDVHARAGTRLPQREGT